jgi:hypothetical protein
VQSSWCVPVEGQHVLYSLATCSVAVQSILSSLGTCSVTVQSFLSSLAGAVFCVCVGSYCKYGLETC